MPLKKIFIASMLLGCGLVAPAQNGGTNWTFGRGCGLHFAPDGTVSQFQSAIYSREGAATASDPATGDLLFYTDGTQVLDATHNVMPNGYGLLGDYSSTQSAVIVPIPDDSLRYYIFTAPILNGYGNYYYSVVNMAANNGLGDVEPATKNTLLLPNASEKIGLARHCNGRDFWLILREGSGNTFQVCLIDKNGVQPPQSFSLGANLMESSWNETGYLRMSSDETMLAHPIGHDLSGNSAALELFGFDNATGTLSGPIVTLTDFGFAYGAEFSADSKLLYVSDIVGQASSFPSAVYQYDVSSGNAQTIANSKVQLITASDYAYGALQLAPNGKIYVAKENGYDIGSFYLDVIESPSVAGSGCNYVLNGLPLTQGTALIGLPHADYRPYQPPPVEVVVPLCKNDTFYLAGVAYTAPDTVTDYTTGTGNCELPTRYKLVELTYNHAFKDLFLCPGSSIIINGNAYSQPAIVTDTLISATDCDTIVQYNIQLASLIPVSQTVRFCPGESVSIGGGTYSQPIILTDTLRAPSGCDTLLTTYLEYQALPQITREIVLCPGETFQINHILYQAPASVTDTLFNLAGCDTLRINMLLPVPPPLAFLGPDTLLCAGDQLTFSSPYDHTVWNGSVTSNPFVVTEPGLVIAEGEDENGCLVRDSVLVQGCCNQQGLYIPNVFSPNDDGLNDNFCVFPGVFCSQYSLRVYDRWGELLFESDAPGPCWDGRFRGRPMPIGVYIWTVEVETAKQRETLSGDVTLVR